MKRFLTGILALSICITMLAGCQNNNTNVSDETIRTTVLNDFMKISEIPRVSEHMNAVSGYLRSWAKENGFRVVRDKFYNIIIDEPRIKRLRRRAADYPAGAYGYDSRSEIYPAGADYRRCRDIGAGDRFRSAGCGESGYGSGQSSQQRGNTYGDGTSLGADDGIGIALAQYILKNAENHGPIRVIFTSNAETSMSGAQNIDPRYLDGKYLINLDWRNDASIGVGSPGISDYRMSRNITWTAPKNTAAYEVSPARLKWRQSGSGSEK